MGLSTTNTNEKLRIVITGGSSGIGEAIALEMAKNNHRIYLTGRNEERLQQVAEKVRTLGSEAHIGIGDVGDEHDVERLFGHVMEVYGGVDVICANAGVGHFDMLESLTVDQFDIQFRTNVRGVFLWLRKILPGMKQQNQGQIVVTSSDRGFTTGSRVSIYAATKHAVQAMVGALRSELEGTMVKAATINPGSVSTPWFDGKNVDRSKMLSMNDVAKAVRLIIDQDETSNIDHILLLPGKN